MGALDVTDLVAVDAPEPLATFLSDGGYLPRGVPLLKRVAAVPGQRVCRTGLAITVDGVPIGEALDRDRRGRPLPVWQGCRSVADGELFLTGRRKDVIIKGGRNIYPQEAEAVIATVDILSMEGQNVAAIGERLARVNSSIIGLRTAQVSESQEVTILADRTVPFSVIKKVMSTCTGKGFGRISLAVLQKGSQAAYREQPRRAS